MTEREQEITTHLRSLADGTVMPVRQDCGLCNELRELDIVPYDIPWLEWPENTHQCVSFPVPPSMDIYENAEHAYIAGHDGDKWNDSPYADARRRLCTWLAGWLEDNWDSVKFYS